MLRLCLPSELKDLSLGEFSIAFSTSKDGCECNFDRCMCIFVCAQRQEILPRLPQQTTRVSESFQILIVVYGLLFIQCPLQESVFLVHLAHSSTILNDNYIATSHIKFSCCL